MSITCRHNNVEITQYMVTSHSNQGGQVIPAMSHDNTPSYVQSRLWCNDCSQWLTEMELLLTLHREIQMLRDRFC